VTKPPPGWFATLPPEAKAAYRLACLERVASAAAEVSEAIGYRDWKRTASRGRELDAALRVLDETKEKP